MKILNDIKLDSIGKHRGTIESDKSLIAKTDDEIINEISQIEQFSNFINGKPFRKLIKKPGMISIVL